MKKTLLLLFFVTYAYGQSNQVPNGTLINWNHSHALSLVGFWLFDEGSGDRVVDKSLNGNDGTLTRMVPLDDWIPGRLGGSVLAYDNNDDTVQIPDNESFTIANGTWSIWFMPDQLIDSTDPVSFYFLMSMNQAGSNAGDIIIFWQYGEGVDGQLRFQMDDNGDVSRVIDTNSASWNQDQWYHCAVTWGAAGMRMYIDGILQTDTDANTDGGGQNTVDLHIGSHSSSTWFTFPGSIDDVRIYNRALTEVEIYSLFSDPMAIFRKPFYGRILTAAAAASARRRGAIF